jgi:integrase
VKEITRSHIRLYLRQVAFKTRVHANRIHATIRKMFNWAMNEEIIALERNPAAGITRPGGKERAKERTLTDDEIKKLWGTLDKMSPQIRDVLRLILLTGQRPGEVMGMRWDEINFDEALWTMQGSRTKNGLSQVVPLNTQAIRIIEKHAEEEEGQRQRREKRGHNASPNMYVFPNKKLKKHADMPVVHVRKATGRIWRATGIQPSSAHDLRRTCATRLGQMEVPGHVIALILNHKQMDITSSIYNQYKYLKEKREALDAWGARLARIISGLELVETRGAENKMFGVETAMICGILLG